MQRKSVSEPTSTRRKQNEGLANAVFDPLSENITTKCHELTNSRGVDVAFDAAGAPQGLEAAFDTLKHKGHYINIAAWEKPVSTLWFSC